MSLTEIIFLETLGYHLTPVIIFPSLQIKSQLAATHIKQISCGDHRPTMRHQLMLGAFLFS